MSVLESKGTNFREMMECGYLQELQMIRSHNYSYDMNFVVAPVQLSKNPHREQPLTSLKAQVYSTTIIENFKIKHVKNLIGRLGEEFTRPVDNTCLAMAGNPQFLTHESGIKNLNVYFREDGEDKQFYTFENSCRNTLILK